MRKYQLIIYPHTLPIKSVIYFVTLVELFINNLLVIQSSLVESISQFRSKYNSIIDIDLLINVSHE